MLPMLCNPASRARMCAATLALLACAIVAPAPAADSISFDRQCFTIQGQDVALYSGSLHYFRCPPELWRDRLIKARAAGFNTIATYIPWNYHEPVKGQLDLSELEKFVDLCDQLGFYFIARPGPFICAEWDNGAFPDWLITEGVDNAAVRTNDAHYLPLVDQWYADVCDVLRPRQITSGGNIVAVQVENEYGRASYFKTLVIRKRYQMLRHHGIDVPIVTCNTDCAWDNDDPVMADIINGNNSNQARWSNVHEIENRAAQARREEYNAPLICLENPMGQGHFSNMMGLTSRTLEANDFNVVNKTIWAHGGGLTNYYMLYGGTNFEYWGSAYQSTSYASRQPVSCPINEPGGLLDSYYEVKLIGHWLETFGPTLVRSEPASDARVIDCSADMQPRLVYKRNGQTAFFFIREAQDKTTHLRLAWTDPATNKNLTIPTTGQITLPARRMITLAANFPLQNALLNYSTSEILSIDSHDNRDLITVYGPARSQGQIALTFDARPDVAGDANHSWDPAARTLTLDYQHTLQPTFIRAGNVAIAILDRETAMTTWLAPLENQSAALDSHADRLPLISNAYLVADVNPRTDALEFEAHSRPGRTEFATFLPNSPKTVQVAGKNVPFSFDPHTGRLAFNYSTPTQSFRPIPFTNARFQSEDLTAGNDWKPLSLTRSLEEQSILGKGYIRYTAHFDHTDDPARMIVRLYLASGKFGHQHQFLGDPILFFINGQCVREASGYWHPLKMEFDPKPYLKPGRNRFDVLLERHPRSNGGGDGYKAGIAEPKGLATVALIGPGETPWIKHVDNWKYTLGLHGQQQGYHLPQYDDSKWAQLPLGNWREQAPTLDSYIGVAWYRMNFNLDEKPDLLRPLALSLDLTANALIYLNGRLVGRYHDIDWQRDFYLPEPWLNLNGQNTIAIAVRNDTSQPDQIPWKAPGLHKAVIKAYENETVQKNKLIINF